MRGIVQLNNEAKSFTAEDSRFWVVRPRLDTSGISGLSTLLSGAYIGADAGVSTETASEFKGLEVPPIVTRDASGQQFLLRATDIGSLDVGSPVYFRRIKVGQVAAYELDGDGRGGAGADTFYGIFGNDTVAYDSAATGVTGCPPGTVWPRTPPSR